MRITFRLAYRPLYAFWVLSVCFIFKMPFFDAEGQVSIDYAKEDLSYLYAATAKVKCKHKVLNVRDQSIIFLKISFPEAELTDYKIFYELKKEGGETSIIDSLDTSRYFIDNQGDDYIFKLVVPFDEAQSVLYLTTTLIATGRSHFFEIPVSLASNFPKTDLLIREKDKAIPIFEDRVSLMDTFRIEALEGQEEELFVFLYRQAFRAADPPMGKAGDQVKKSLAIDSVFRIKPGNKINFREKGLYFVQKDTATLEGIAFRVVDPYYPKITNAEDLLAALTYISTKSERVAFTNAVDKKKALDAFWLQHIKSEKGAQQTIKNYYQHVKNANTFFTNYKEGWKTDQGMIFIIFGPPDEVYRTLTQEVWLYEARGRERKKLNFTFTKIKNIFCENHYSLIYSKKYEDSWYTTVGNWRKGIR